MGAGNYVALIGILMGACSIVRMAVDAFHLPLTKIVRNVIKTYVVVFHTMFDVIFIWLPFKVPSSVKDLVILYVVLGSSTASGEFVTVLADLRHPWLLKSNYRESKVRFWTSAAKRLLGASIGWPLWLWRHRARPHLAYGLGGHGPSRATFCREAPGPKYAYICDVRLVIATRLICIFVAAAVIIVLNYAYSI